MRISDWSSDVCSSDLDGVYVGAGVVRLRHVVVRHIDFKLLNRVDRDRLAIGRQTVGVQAKSVIDRHAIDGDRVETGVLAKRRNLAAFLVGLRQTRIETGVVLQIAVDRRKAADLFAGDGDRKSVVEGKSVSVR